MNRREFVTTAFAYRGLMWYNFHVAGKACFFIETVLKEDFPFGWYNVDTYR